MSANTLFLLDQKPKERKAANLYTSELRPSMFFFSLRSYDFWQSIHLTATAVLLNFAEQYHHHGDYPERSL